MKMFRRRQYVVNRPLQFISSGIIIYILLIGIMAVGVATYYITLNTILSQLEAEGSMLHAYETVRNINILLARRIGSLLLGVMAFAFVLGVYYLHRVAGPIYRIEKTLTDIADGKTPDLIKLRRKDYFKPLAATVNRIIGNMRKPGEE